jgi:ElaB/YqjD/DUF883 family membrane-anchored ribosome-binding protein
MAAEQRWEGQPPLVGPAARGKQAGFEPETTDEARYAIAEARGRISSTLDSIETRIQDRKEELKARMDVGRPISERVRARPWPTLGTAMAIGALLGLLTGLRR